MFRFYWMVGWCMDVVKRKCMNGFWPENKIVLAIHNVIGVYIYYSWWNKKVSIYIYIQSYKWSIQWWLNLPTPGGPDLVELRAPYSTNFDRGSWRLCGKASKFRCATIHLSQQKWSWKEDRCMTAIFNWCSHHPPLRIFYLWKFAYVHTKKFEEKLQCFSRSLCSAFARHLNEDLFWTILCTSSKLWLKLKVTSSRFWLKSSPTSQHRCQARDFLKYSICEICSFLQLVFLIDKREEKNLNMQIFYPKINGTMQHETSDW